MLYMVIVLSPGRRASRARPDNDAQARDSAIVWPVRRHYQVGDRASSDVRHLSAATAGMHDQMDIATLEPAVREAHDRSRQDETGW
jgi:hypothetical protein